jgi:hypothetical protein
MLPSSIICGSLMDNYDTGSVQNLIANLCDCTCVYKGTISSIQNEAAVIVPVFTKALLAQYRMRRQGSL